MTLTEILYVALSLWLIVCIFIMVYLVIKDEKSNKPMPEKPLPQGEDLAVQSYQCPLCEGRGVILDPTGANAVKCHVCKGEGRVEL